MKDKNFVFLEGIVGNYVKHGKAVNGKNFITFNVCINTYDSQFHDQSEIEHPTALIRVFVYDAKQVEYLNKVKIRRGHRVSIAGRLASSSREFGGTKIVVLVVVVRDITVAKTSDDYKYTNEEIKEIQ